MAPTEWSERPFIIWTTFSVKSWKYLRTNCDLGVVAECRGVRIQLPSVLVEPEEMMETGPW